MIKPKCNMAWSSFSALLWDRIKAAFTAALETYLIYELKVKSQSKITQKCFVTIVQKTHRRLYVISK